MPFLLILLFSLSAFAQKNIVVLGGGGEPAGAGTIFDDNIRTLGNYFNKNSDWNIDVSFNGGHANTERFIAEGLGRRAGGATPFTEQNYNLILSEYEEKINSGTIKPGEQLLIFIATHGGQKTEKEKTHSISTSGKAIIDYTTAEGSDTVSMDKLQKLADLAAAKGVKLGIVDSSCHSGASIALKNDKTCVITASGPNHFGYSSFGDSFASHMKKGKNLEQVFLETFTNRNETAFPMISTATGVKLQDELYPLISPYLFSYNAQHDKLKTFLEHQVMENKCAVADENYNRILELSQDMEKTLNGKKSDFTKFRAALADYHQYQSKISKDLQAMNVGDFLKTEKFCPGKNPKNNPCYDYSIKDILSMDVDSEIKRFQEKKAKEPQNAGWIDLYLIGIFEQVKAKKAELLATHPEYVRYQDYYQKELPKFQQESWDKALAVSESLQKIYSKSYKTMASEDRAPNPCKDFVL